MSSRNAARRNPHARHPKSKSFARSRRRSTTKSDPIRMLKTDHTRVLEMLERLETTAKKSDGKARDLMDQIDRS